MTFKQLEYVLQIHRSGSMRKAAELSYITQPALSQQLRRLEEELGFEIFDRTTTPMKPTEAGHYYLDVIQNILQQNEKALNWLHERTEDEVGRVTLGITNTRSKIFMPALLPKFKLEHPNIKVIIREEQIIQRLGQLLSDGEVDVALVLENNFAFKNFSFTFLKEEEILLAVPKGSSYDLECHEVFQQQGFVPLTTCKDHPFIILKEGTQFRSIANLEFAKIRSYPPVVLETSNSDLAHSMAAAGYGSTLVGGMMVKYDNFYEKLSYYPISYPPYLWTFGLIHHPDCYVSPAMQTFISFMRDNIDIV